MSGSSLAIICSVCGADTFVRREPVYEGFKKTGERFFCLSCGHEFACETDVPFQAPVARPRLFSEEDRSPRPSIFHGDEMGRNCRHCRHYVMNPFVQRCGLHGMAVQATDLCDAFETKPEAPEEDPLARLLK